LKKYCIHLSAEERTELTQIACKQQASAQRKLRAQILLRSDQGPDGPAEIDAVIAGALPVTTRTIESLREWVCEVGPIAALERRPTSRVYERRLDGHGEARLIALALSSPPTGRATWTLQLLADSLVELQIVDSIDDNTIQRTLKKMNSNPTSVSTG
jgi:hypothetical protein